MEQSAFFQGSSIFPSTITNSSSPKILKLITVPQYLKFQNKLLSDNNNEFKKNSNKALDLSYSSLIKTVNLNFLNNSKFSKKINYLNEPILIEQIFNLEKIDNKISNSFLPDLTSSIALKPPHSYIGLIAMAILNGIEQQKTLSEIYEWIIKNYPYFKWRGTGWRNSIRHNLSLNDCFIKSNRASNGKGHYWTIHPANLHDFMQGDFRRKQAQWKVKSHFVSEQSMISALKNINTTNMNFFNKSNEKSKNKKLIKNSFHVSSLLN